MNSQKVVFDQKTFGVTSLSLQMLRNILCETYKHQIVIYEIPTEEICCGFLIFDRNDEITYYTGDGFRTDGRGEGGAGYKSAQAIFSIFGIRNVMVWDDTPLKLYNSLTLTFDISHIGEKLTEYATQIFDTLDVYDFVCPSKELPIYLRN